MENIENKYYIYEWFINETDEVFYVGKGSGNRYKKKNKRNKFFTDMYNTHTCDVRIVKRNLTEKEAFEEEYKLIQFYKETTDYRLTNQTLGGAGSKGYKISNETKEKISKAIKTKWQEESFRNNMIKLRNDENSVYKSREFREKMSNIVKGDKNPNYRHFWSEEKKKELSEKQKALNNYKRENNPNSKKIMCIETGEIFNCIKDAMEKYNVKCAASFTVALNKPTRTAANLHWQTIE